MCRGSLDGEIEDIRSHHRETAMMSNLIPYLVAEDSFRRERAREQIAAARRGRKARRARWARAH
jgi:hypothetical protein